MAHTHTMAATTRDPMPFEAHSRQVALRAAMDSIVLLENRGILPMEPCPVALFGAGAEMTVKGGTGSGEVNERHSISIREGLEQAGFSITTESWLAEYRKRWHRAREDYGREFRRKLYRLRIKEVANLMNDPFTGPVGQAITPQDMEGTDTCIYVVARQAGEGSDRKLDRHDYSLTPEEQAQIALCAKHFARFVLVLNVGGPFDMGFLEEIPVGAVLFYAQQGGMGGLALAKLLRGEQSPSACLADTWPMTYGDIPFGKDYSYLNGNPQTEHYREDIFVGYRYYDSFGVRPRYHFGYGLSYTRFSTRVIGLDESLTLRLRVTNEGSCRGAHVVQLYAACPQTGTLPKELRRLVAFGKTDILEPGASRELTLSFGAEDLASYRESDDTTVLERGKYVLYLHSEPVAALELAEEAVLQRHKSLCAPKEQIHRLTVPTATLEAVDVPVIPLKVPQTKVFSYEEQEPAALSLTTQQMAQLCVGGGMFSHRSQDAPGAAGVTTDALQKLGIPQRVMADGPAGVRLAQHSVELKNGRVKPVKPPMEFMGYLPGFVKAFLCADPKKGRSLYQFTTAFPVELALAQSWDTALLEEVGQAVGQEMAAYGVRYWLAPALNIHRNPLCGRNFEYYSEDPLLSGHLAAAVSRGVQSVAGRFVTLKHFACNNQETCRNTTDAVVSKRALREIYLRGFQIAMAAKPGAVMTSYNKLNGVYTPNSHDLVTDILRCEWGFDGLVMTDWMSTGRGLAEDGACIAAGNDLIMPGGPGNVRAILRALKAGRITPEQLQRCAGNVLKSLTK